MNKKIILSIIIIALVVFLLFLFLQNYKNNNSVPLGIQIPTTITANAANPDVSIISPDGKTNLTMKTVVDNNSIIYTFTTNNLIYTKTTTKDDIFAIPFNSWSPDNKYVFLKETNGNTTSFLVLNSSGVPFKDGSQYINISDNFTQKLNNYKLDDITGWAAGTLLVLNTNKIDGEKGPSFWFDLTSSTFIQLSNRFN